MSYRYFIKIYLIEDRGIIPLSMLKKVFWEKSSDNVQKTLNDAIF